jgi:putative transposase
MVKTHYSCAELADLKLPGYPISKKGWYAVVDREGWELIEVAGSGGRGGIRREYAVPHKIARLIESRSKISADGTEARELIALRAKFRAEAKVEKARKTEVKEFEIRERLSIKGQLKFDAHFDILLAFRDYFKANNEGGNRLRRNAAFKAFAGEYNAGHIKVGEVARAKYTEISPRSIQRWVLENEQTGLISCADMRAVKGSSSERKSIIEQHPEIEKYFLAVITEKPHIQNKHLTEVLNELRIAKFGDEPSGEIYCPHISYDAVNRYRTKYEKQHAMALTAATSPKKFKNNYMSSLGSQDEAVTYLNQLWLMDGTPAEYDLTDGRHTASVVLDVWSRDMKILFSKTARTETNKLLMREAVLDWGMTDNAKTDNGTDYVGREMLMFFEEMGIPVEQCNAFCPWEKGMVERGIHTFLHSILEILDNFMGHSVAERAVIEDRRSFSDQLFKKNAVVKINMSSAEMQQLTNAWLAGTYRIDKHRTLEMSPLEKRASYTGSVKRITNERALDILMYKPVRSPTITKKGIRYDKQWFIHAELMLHVGKVANICLDPNNMGKIIVRVEGKFLCIASNAMLDGINRAEVAAHGKAKQNAFIAEKKAEFRKAKKSLPVSLHDLAISMVMDRAEKAGKVVILEKKAEEYSTAALVEAERVALAQQGVQASIDAEKLREEAAAAMKAARAEKVVAIPANPLNVSIVAGMTPEQRYDHWLMLDAKNKRDGDLENAEERRWHKGFTDSTTYRSQKAMRDSKLNDIGKK